MAGGAQETPRQRMIGMMYLVLTALLALQVQNEVLEKFYFIDASLQDAKEVGLSTNSKIITSMSEQIKESGSNQRDLAVLKKAQDVKDESAKMIARIQDIRKAIIEAMGAIDPETGAYPQGDKYDDINRLMLGTGENQDGFAFKLQDELNAYVNKVAAIDDTLGPILKGAGLMPLAKEKADEPRYQAPKYDGMEWEHINFQNTPMVAALAVLSQLENDVVKVETKSVDAMRGRIGEFQIKFDKVSAMASAESNTVAAGTKYKASMFISATSTTLAPKMSASGAGAVRVDGDGVGTVEFTASGGTTEGAKKTWQGSITIRNAAGEDTTLTVKKEYTVVSPVIEIESGTINSLYLKCGNDLKVKVPALGVEYNPSFTASGGSVLNGSGGKGSIILVPNSASVTLNVTSGGNPIGSKKFGVKMVPKPDVIPKGLNMKQGGACPRSITMLAVADESFKSQLPKDARYRVAKFRVTLARGKRPMGVVEGNGQTADISSLGQKAKPGDRLIIETISVQRMNFQNNVENVSIGQSVLTYSIN
ncbi:MAG: gliding motility protein GldM [Flexibacter sp. CG_4_10_14_3_um_filter_32_15]|nr:MAG: gliding motility protein GldM [Flexibacter sp. CG_4_10_14_3_um_filter_32_15]